METGSTSGSRHGHDRLRDPVRDRGHAEHSRAPVSLRSPPPAPAAGSSSPTTADSTACRGSRQVRLKLLDRLAVDARRALVGLDPQLRLPDGASRSQTTSVGSLTGSSRATPVDHRAARTTRPLRSSPITGPSSLLRDGPPLCPASVLSPSRFPPLGALPLDRPQATTAPLAAAYRGDRFPRSMQEPRPGSRHLHAGHHLANQQAPARLVPGPKSSPVSMPLRNFRHVISGSLYARLLDPHLTRSRRDFSRDAHHHGS